MTNKHVINKETNPFFTFWLNNILYILELFIKIFFAKNYPVFTINILLFKHEYNIIVIQQQPHS
jgi:hypothetical protein